VPRTLRIIGKLLAALVIVACLAAVAIPRFLDRIYYWGIASAHFDGARFFNPDGDADTIRPPGSGSRAGFFWNQLTRRDGRPAWPDTVPIRASRPAARVTGDRMVATWVGHATVLVQTAGLNILTDPVWSEHAGPFGFGPKRVTAPGIAFADLPPIDLVLVSHNHYDHMDLATLKRLWDRDQPAIVTSLGNDALLRSAGIEGTARDWRSRVSVYRHGASAMVTVVRNHHWGSRWFADRNRALWSAFVVDTPSGSIFFAGDTGMGDGRWPAEAARAAAGPIRLALLPIGAFRFVPGQMSSGSHIGPVQGAEVFRRLGASTAIPIHWGTFRLSYEGYDTPPRLLAAALRCAGQDPRRFAAATIGRPVEVPPATLVPPATPSGPACLETPAVRALR